MRNTSLLPDTAYRVNANTAAHVNAQILQNTVRRLETIGHDFGKIEARLKEIDREWDIERAIECNASTLMLASTALAVSSSKKWLILSGLVSGFLLQHAIQGWCPPVPVLRRLGFRTQREIDDERAVLLGRLGRQPRRTQSAAEALKTLDRRLPLS